MRQQLDASLQTALETWQESVTPDACGDLLLTVNTPDATRILLADATGHGPAAARIAQRFERIARGDLHRLTTAAVFRKWNARLREDLADGAFVTATVVEIERVSGVIRIWNAGNPAPLWLRSETSQITPLQSYSVLLGVFEPGLYQPPTPQEIRPEAGDAVLAFSDGLTDQRCGERHFGDQLLTETLSAAIAAGDNPLAELKDSLADFRGDARPADDLTAVQLSWRRVFSQSQPTAQRIAA